jgi:hypothetical protein
MSLEDPKPITTPPFLLQIGQRFQSLIWTCLDFDLVRSAVFYAERNHVMDENNHDARHLYAFALLRSGQPHSGLQLVNGVQQSKCSGCLEIKGKCCAALGRHRLAREAFEASLQDSSYTPDSARFILYHRALANFARSFYEHSDLARFHGGSCYTMSGWNDGNERQSSSACHSQFSTSSCTQPHAVGSI